MRVLTLNSIDFQAHCRKLAERISDDGFQPDCIIGIRNGGAYVANEMSKAFPDAERIEVSVSRPTHRQKNNSLMKSIVSKLPVWLLDALRMAESCVAQLRTKGHRNAEINISDDINARKILVVDDAIDTGATMQLVLNALRERFPDADIRSAVLTITTPAPCVTSNYYLFNNRTLIRFPWAIDAKI